MKLDRGAAGRSSGACAAQQETDGARIMNLWD